MVEHKEQLLMRSHPTESECACKELLSSLPVCLSVCHTGAGHDLSHIFVHFKEENPAFV